MTTPFPKDVIASSDNPILNAHEDHADSGASEDRENEALVAIDLRVSHLEQEVGKIHDTLTQFAEIVVSDIRERRETEMEQRAQAPISSVAELVAAAATHTANDRRPWLLFDFFRELGTTVRMYLDPRYRMRRATQLMVPLLIGGMVLNYLLWNMFLQFPLLGFLQDFFERICLILLGIIFYKVISRELVRYREHVRLFNHALATNPNRSGVVHVSNDEPPSTLESTE